MNGQNEKSPHSEEIAVLKAQIEAANESQKKITQVITTACGMIVTTAVLLVGWNVVKSYWIDERDKAAFRAEFTNMLAETTTKFERKIDERAVTIFNQQAPTLNKSIQSLTAAQLSIAASIDLASKNYPDGTARAALACAYFLGADDEGNTRTWLKVLAAQLVPNLEKEQLQKTAYAFPEVPIGQHLTNLIMQVRDKNPNGRFTVELRELQNAITDVQTKSSIKP
jgi:hypothetical protein